MTEEKKQKATQRMPPIETRFKKGQSGNPKGKIAGTKNRATIARKVLEMRGALPEEAMKKLKNLFPDIKNDMTIEELMTIKMVGEAITKGDTQAYKVVMDSGYGSPSQAITGDNGGPVQFEEVRKITDKEHMIGVFETALKVFKKNESE